MNLSRVFLKKLWEAKDSQADSDMRASDQTIRPLHTEGSSAINGLGSAAAAQHMETIAEKIGEEVAKDKKVLKMYIMVMVVIGFQLRAKECGHVYHLLILRLVLT